MGWLDRKVNVKELYVLLPHFTTMFNVLMTLTFIYSFHGHVVWSALWSACLKTGARPQIYNLPVLMKDFGSMLGSDRVFLANNLITN